MTASTITDEIMDGAKPAIVPITALRPNPNNPRADLGDLEELSDSIQAQGIIQKPIVMPHPTIEGDYLILAGHRRHAAAKMAGLLDIPVEVTRPLSEAQQQAVILIENVHRSDLKPSEEAAGVQALFDLGFSAAQVSASTGFSSTKVRSRAGVARLSASQQEKVNDRQIKLEDVASLSEFDAYPELREKVADTLGSSWEFSQAQASARRQIAWDKHIDGIKEYFEHYGIINITTSEKEQYGFTAAMTLKEREGLPTTIDEAIEFNVEDLPEALKENSGDYALVLDETNCFIRWGKKEDPNQQEEDLEEKARIESYEKASALLEDERQIFMARFNTMLNRPSEIKDMGKELLVESFLQYGPPAELLDTMGIVLPEDFEGNNVERTSWYKAELMKKTMDQLSFAFFYASVLLSWGKPARQFFNMAVFSPSRIPESNDCRIKDEVITSLLGYEYGKGAKAAQLYYEPVLPGTESQDEVNF